MRKQNEEYTKEQQEINRTILRHYNIMLAIASAKRNQREPRKKRTKVPYAQTLAEKLNPKLKQYREKVAAQNAE